MIVLSDIRVLNFDNSVTCQKDLLDRFTSTVVDLTAIGPSARLWADPVTARHVQKVLEPAHRHMPTLFGSGDFHHISSLLIEQFEEPLTVIVFDHHPDWDIFPPQLGCASWVTRTLKQRNIEKIILLGVSSGDISAPSLQKGNTRALANDRLEIYPYAHAPSKVFFKDVPSGRCVRLSRQWFMTEIQWQQLGHTDLKAFMESLASRIKGRRVYVSIDKDCLRSEAALTNWEEGKFSLDQLRLCLKVIREHLEIAGVDITGEYSPPRVRGFVKSVYSRLDHPKYDTAANCPQEVVLRVNQGTNIKILETLSA